MDTTFFVLDRNKASLTPEELGVLDSMSVQEIKALINECDEKYNYHNAIQNAFKLIINSVYGAFGNKHFVCSTLDIAEAITSMGRNLIKHMDAINEEYWYEHWPNDTELHEILEKRFDIDISKVGKINNSWIHRETGVDHEGEVTQHDIDEGIYQRKNPTSNYIDTDSLFISFHEVMEQLDISEEDAQEFIQCVCKNRLEPLFKSKLNKAAKKYKVKNIQDFELENINESVMFLAKKKYIKHTVWEDGTQYPRLQNIVAKNVAIIKRGTPKFARKKLMDIILYFLNNTKTYNIKDLLKFVREMRKEFELTDVDDIVGSTNINNYYSSKILEKGQMIDAPGIVEDKSDLIWGKGTYFTIKAAGLYNYLLNQHPELTSNYDLIRPGTKVKIYPCIHEKNNKFCYIWGSYPKEFAPPVDYDELFQKTISDNVNEYIKSLGLPELNKRLKVVISLF